MHTKRADELRRGDTFSFFGHANQVATDPIKYGAGNVRFTATLPKGGTQNYNLLSDLEVEIL